MRASLRACCSCRSRGLEGKPMNDKSEPTAVAATQPAERVIADHQCTVMKDAAPNTVPIQHSKRDRISKSIRNTWRMDKDGYVRRADANWGSLTRILHELPELSADSTSAAWPIVRRGVAVATAQGGSGKKAGIKPGCGFAAGEEAAWRCRRLCRAIRRQTGSGTACMFYQP